MSEKAQAAVPNNELVSAVAASVMQVLGPVLDKIAITPERMNELKKPYIDPAVEARNLRERKRQQEEIRIGLEQKKLQQDQCPHRNAHGDSISLIHNYPDGQTRGVCMNCHKVIQPAHWEIDAQGNGILVPADPQYERVLVIESTRIDA